MQIEQIDRDAAVSLIREAQNCNVTEYLTEIEDGAYDENFFVQAFARHRLAALSARPAVAEDVVERVAFALWKAEAERAAPNVAKNRTPEAFADESAETREKWHLMARAAIAAMGSADMGKGEKGDRS